MPSDREVNEEVERVSRLAQAEVVKSRLLAFPDISYETQTPQRKSTERTLVLDAMSPVTPMQRLALRTFADGRGLGAVDHDLATSTPGTAQVRPIREHLEAEIRELRAELADATAMDSSQRAEIDRQRATEAAYRVELESMSASLARACGEEEMAMSELQHCSAEVQEALAMAHGLADSEAASLRATLCNAETRAASEAELFARNRQLSMQLSLCESEAVERARLDERRRAEDAARLSEACCRASDETQTAQAWRESAEAGEAAARFAAAREREAQAELEACREWRLHALELERRLQLADTRAAEACETNRRALEAAELRARHAGEAGAEDAVARLRDRVLDDLQAATAATQATYGLGGEAGGGAARAAEPFVADGPLEGACREAAGAIRGEIARLRWTCDAVLARSTRAS